MPELPEVEVIRRGLERFLVGQKIIEAKIYSEKNFIGPKEVLIGREIVELRRFGKALIIDCSEGVSIMVHLRMTGQMIYRDGSDFAKSDKGFEKDFANKSFAGGHPSESFFEELPNKQTRVEFVLEDDSRGGSEKGLRSSSEKSSRGGRLFFNDQRKFGFCKVLETEKISEETFIRTLGKEPWEMREAEFFEKLQRHKGAPIKAVILDQKVIAGVGNIYADESLWVAKIHPATMAGKVSASEAGKLLRAIREVMDKSIESGGSTMQTYVKADGTRGDYLRLFAKVFRREGEACERCGGEIEKMRVAGRGTHFCPKCQKVR